ncbi:MAG TPA: 50S ribosomal protein L24 [Pirellulales bacterium]|jgi:large subunit ribosomal protein L24|nr:50S ribosomal protein L24 [Pirellulales bacterium]
MHIRQDDIVQVIAGEERGVRGKVLSVSPKSGKVVVEGVNRVYKHMKRSQKNPQGGRLSKEMPVDASNIMLVDPQTDKPTRVGVRVTKEGSRERYSKRSGASLGAVSAVRKESGKKRQ